MSTGRAVFSIYCLFTDVLLRHTAHEHEILTASSAGGNGIYLWESTLFRNESNKGARSSLCLYTSLLRK